MIWADFEAAAPELARLGRERFDRTGVALLGTLRQDGSPRISPVEPYFAQGRLLLGLMSWSLKARDLLRDPRCTLHSAVSAPDAGEAEFKLYGRVVEVRDDAIRASCSAAWWVSRPPEAAIVLSFSVEQAGFVSWDLERGRMTVRRWAPNLGVREVTRDYP